MTSETLPAKTKNSDKIVVTIGDRLMLSPLNSGRLFQKNRMFCSPASVDDMHKAVTSKT